MIAQFFVKIYFDFDNIIDSLKLPKGSHFYSFLHKAIGCGVFLCPLTLPKRQNRLNSYFQRRFSLVYRWFLVFKNYRISHPFTVNHKKVNISFVSTYSLSIISLQYVSSLDYTKLQSNTLY